MYDLMRVEVLKSLKELSRNLDNLFFLKNLELLLQREERVFAIFHHHVQMCLARVDLIQLHDVLVLQVKQQLYLSHQILLDLTSVLLRHRFLSQQYL